MSWQGWMILVPWLGLIAAILAEPLLPAVQEEGR
jgi:hypothetical protein